MAGRHSTLIACLLIGLVGLVQGFRPGDFIPLSRRAQFLGHRTQWHDVHGEHCPRFDYDEIASIPLPRPRLGFRPGDTYKIQLSINGEQVLTPWLPVLGIYTPPYVYLDIEMVHSNGNLESARATVRTMAPEDATRLHSSTQQWVNATHWPKMLPVYYTWTAGPEVRGERALLFLFGSAAAMMAIVVRNAWSAYREKLASFVVDVTRAPQPKAD